jgi:RNA-directed DNA polymerase
MARFQREVKRLTNRNWGVSMDRRMKELAQYLRGWMAYFWISESYRPIPEIDQWVRRRVRCTPGFSGAGAGHESATS